MPNVTAMPHMIQDNFVSVLFGGRQYPVSKGQPTFKALHKALVNKQWTRVPKLLSLSAQLAEKSHGRVTVTASGVAYKGLLIDNVLTAKIMELIEHGKPVAHMLRFMDNLYLNPDMETVNEVYEWLASGRFALTDDGCFIAYKKVRNDFKDIYTETYDNTPGKQPITMPRSAVDPDRRNECSYGFHFCSKRYLPNYGGSWSGGQSRIVEVKVNPADVVAIPRDYGYSKGRTWRYESVREVKQDEMIEGTTDSPVMMQPVIIVAAERNALIRQVKALPSVKRLLRRGQLTAESFTKASTERLTGWLRKFSRMDIAPAKSKLFDNPIRFSREVAGKSLGEVAKAAGISLQEAYNAERCLHPEQSIIDKMLTAIAKLQGITFPVRSAASASYAADAPSVPVVEEEDDEIEEEDDNFGETYDDGWEGPDDDDEDLTDEDDE